MARKVSSGNKKAASEKKNAKAVVKISVKQSEPPAKKLAGAPRVKPGQKANGKSKAAKAPIGERASGGQKLVIVESPTKAKTIRKFLGRDFVVESCMGHIRDLPQSARDIPEKYKKEPWASLGVNVEKHFDPLYCVPKDKLKVVKNLKDKLENASELYLATDEDREGESISWHLTEVLKPQVPVKRMVFHEITKEAITKSLQSPRAIDGNLVKAQEARRILDRLVGYSLSPLLWKKIAYGLSAGRVQSVAVRLISEREHERLRFKKAQYWGVSAQLIENKIEFEGRLNTWKGQKVATGKDFDGRTGKLVTNGAVVLDGGLAKTIQQQLAGAKFIVSEVEEKPVFRKPPAPFITSTLQQEANRKMGLGSRETMQVAQKLYEQGLITYMRTDSTSLSQEALQAARSWIQREYGSEYLPERPRLYEGKKVKGAQEAHEAIRPAGVEFIAPDATGLTGTPFKLYELIWKRTVASQMVDAKQKQVSVRIKSGDALFASSGMSIEFPGFLRAYVEGSDDPEAELQEREVRLPILKMGQSVTCRQLEPTEHETKPPARFTEASLVQTMEREGIGRPSTYASIIGTIIDRGYVRKNNSALVPTFTALVVSRLLSEHLPQYVDLDFTSEMEKSLDLIADGDLDSQDYLQKTYFGKTGIKHLIEVQEKKIDPEKARAIELEGLSGYVFRVGKYGAYLSAQKDGAEVRASVPDSESPADITAEIADKLIERKLQGNDALGKDPATGLPIYVLSGRFGPYVQLGDMTDEGTKPKRVSVPAGMTPEDIKLPQALQLLELPKVLGQHPSLSKPVQAGLGRFGPFVVCDGDYRSIPKTLSIFEVTFEKAMELLSQPKRGRGRAAPLKELGPHPSDQVPVNIMNGPYGPYVKWGKVNASLPEGVTPDAFTLQNALAILAEKQKTSPKGRGARSNRNNKS